MLTHLRPALTMVAAMTLLTGLAYPLAITGLAQALFPAQSNGSLLTRDGQVVGSALIGQSFTSPRYLQGRPSATTAADPADATKTIPAPYNAANSSGSNLGPTAQPLAARVAADIARLRAENPDAPLPIPADLVTTSASGLDPEISPDAARFQIPRIARARGLPEARVRAVIERHIQPRLFGLWGEPRVNVLDVNLALDRDTGG